MSTVNNYILFQAYGNKGIIAECRLALVELLKHNDPAGITVVLYTDDAGAFENELDLFDNKLIRLVSAEDIQGWKGTINFVHRVKIKVLQDFFQQHTGNVIYCDTDTCCLRSLNNVFASIDNGELFMHINEGQIKEKKDIEARKWFRFLRSKEFEQHQLLNDPCDTYMMNAGVIGMRSKDAGLLEKIVSITDVIYPRFPRHTVEQFAFSYVFQKQAAVWSAEKEIFHYWDLKEYRIFLQEFFSVAGDMPVEKQQRLLKDFAPQQIMDQKFKYKRSAIFKRPFLKKWNIDDYIEAMKRSVTNE